VIPPDCKMLQVFKLRKGSCGLAAAAFQMLGKARHDFHEIARHVPVVELVFQDTVPGVAAGAGGARQHEDEGLVDKPCGGARLDGGGTDFFV